MPRYWSSLLLLLVACSPTQPPEFCETSSDCGEGHVCDASTRRCHVDTNTLPSGLDWHGEFFCWQWQEGETTLGYLNMALGPDMASPLGLSIDRGLRSHNYCQAVYVAEHDVWRMLTRINDPREQRAPILFSVVIESSSAVTGRVQNGGPGSTYFFVFQEEDGAVLQGSQSGRAQMHYVSTNEVPRYFYGEFSGRRE